MDRSIDQLIAAVATPQHSVFARWQVPEVDARALLRRTRRGLLVAESRNVLRFAAAPRTDEQRIMAATLDLRGGAVASFSSAAWIWRFPGFTVRDVEVTARRDQHPTSSLATVHHHRLLLEEHVTHRHGIPVT